MEDSLAAYSISVERPEKNSPLGRPRRRWKIILNGSTRSGMGAMDWIDLAQDRDRWRALVCVCVVMELWVP